MAEDKKGIRPRTFEEFVGQTALKEQARKVINAAKLVNEPVGHTLLTGGAGLGKTSFAAILAKERGVDFVPLFSSSLKSVADMREILRTRLNDKGYIRTDPEPKIPSEIEPTVLFIDEVHQVPKQVRESLYTVMEDRIYWDEDKNPWGGKTIRKTWVPKFTLVAATTAEGVLEKPFLDRFENHWKFERYSDEECKAFVKRALENLPVGVKATEDCIVDIANRSRGTARVAINLTKSIANMSLGSSNKAKDLALDKTFTNQAFKEIGIDEIGLTRIDYAILKYLVKNYRPCGIKAVATALEETPDSLERIYEPFLVAKDLIRRTPQGRVISELGIEYLRNKNLIPPSTRRQIENEY